MATLQDLEIVLDSIQLSMESQNSILLDTLEFHKAKEEERKTRNRINEVDRSSEPRVDRNNNSSDAMSNVEGIRKLFSGTGAGLSKLFSGLGGGLGALLGGLGGGAAGLAAILYVGSIIDGEKVKDNVNAILSIGDGKDLTDLFEGGAVILALYGLGKAMIPFAIGGIFNAGLMLFANETGTENWAESVVYNVRTLLGVFDDVKAEDSARMVNKTIGIVATLGALGAGLAIFGAGGAFAAGLNYFAEDGWAEEIKNNVLSLLSIGSEMKMSDITLFDATTGIPAALSTLGVALAFFGTGAAITNAVSLFSEPNWGENVKDNVLSLLSIAKDENSTWGGASEFIVVMGALSAGLIAFSIGQGSNALASGASEAINMFTNNEGFAQRIKNEVATLLSIVQLPGIGESVGKFAASMLGITAGLAVFATGKLYDASVDGASDAVQMFTGSEDFAQRIYDEVSKLVDATNLLSDGDGDTSKAGRFALGMTKVAFGLTALATGEFVSGLASAATSILSFFSGAETPFEQIMKVADDSDKLIEGATAMERIARALNDFSNITLSNIELDFTAMAKNLGQAIPLFEALATGGKISDPSAWLWGSIDFGAAGSGGILNPNLRIEEIADRINTLKRALSLDLTMPSDGDINSSINQTMNSQSMQILSGYTDNMILLSENILRSLEKIEDIGIRSNVPSSFFYNNAPVYAPSTVNGGSTTSVINAFPTSGSDLDYGMPRGPF